MTVSPQLTLDLARGYQLNLPGALFDQLSMGIAVFDRDFSVQGCNRIWADLLSRHTQLSAGQLRPGIKLFDFAPELEAIFKPLFQQVLNGETIRRDALQLDSRAGADVSYWDLTLTPFTKTETVIVMVMSDATERVLAYQEFENQTKAHAHGLATLLEISRRLVSLEKEPLLQLVLDRLKDIEDYTEAGITKLEDDQLTVLAYQGIVSEEAWMSQSISVSDSAISRQVIYDRKPVIVPDIWSDSVMAQTLRGVIGTEELEKIRASLRSWMAVPLMAREQVIGMLFLGHNAPDHFSSQRVEMIQTLADHVAVALEIDRLSRQALNLATLEERDWLARELHDNVAQALGCMNLQIASISELLAGGQLEEAQDNLRELKQIVGETYTDVREEIFNLRATTSLGLGFLDTLRDYLTRYRTYYGMNVQLAMAADETSFDLPAKIGNQVIRIIQEALINVRKHAGVNEAAIRLKRADERICISVEDNGKGFDPSLLEQTEQVGFGLQIMAERAEGVGGLLEVDPAPGQGVRVMIWLPIIYRR